MTKRACIMTICASLAVFLTSCENKELLAKRDAQKVEIEELNAAYEAVAAELKDDPGDQSRKLKAAKKEVKKIRETLDSLNQEVETLKKQRDKLQGEFENYKKKYPL